MKLFASNKLLKVFICLLIVNTSYATSDTLYVHYLAGFCKVWGHLKYYSHNNKKQNWDCVFREFYPKVRRVKNKDEYNVMLDELFIKYGNLKKTKILKNYYRDTTISNLDLSWINNELFSSALQLKLKDIIKYYKPQKSIWLKKETLPGYNGASFYSAKTIYPDTSEALLAFFKYWNLVNHFFAYKSLMDIPWDSTLYHFIPKIISSVGRPSYYLILSEITSRLNDSHSFWFSGEALKQINNKFGIEIPVRIDLIDNNHVVNNLSDTASMYLNIRKGDCILKVNNIPIENIRNDIEKYYAKSIKSMNNAYRFLRIKKNMTNTIKLNRNGENIEIAFYVDSSVLNIMFQHQSKFNEKYKNWEIIANNYAYLKPSRLKPDQLGKIFRNIKDTKAIIIDLRGYGGIPTYFISMRLTNQNIPYAILYTADRRFPGVYQKKTLTTNYLGISFLKKKYKGKLVVLIDDSTISGVELETMWFQAIGATVIGRTSNGTDGTCKVFIWNESFASGFSHDAVYYPDGRCPQRFGIQPDIVVDKSIDALINNKDEILEKAVEFLDKSYKY